jgi:flagellar biosynthetic protein FliR
MTGLIAALTEATGIAQEVIWSASVVFLRVGAAMAMMPGFGEMVVPARIRLGLALAFTAVVFPAVAPNLPGPETGILPVLTTETVAGLALGAALRLFVHALQIAGMIIAQSTSLAQLFAGGQAEPQPATGHLLVMAGIAAAMAAGLHVTLAAYLIQSYDLLPAGRLPQASDLAEWGVARVGHAFALAFSLAMPFVIAGFLYNLALGIINRAMPQLMVAFVGAPALGLGGLLLLALVAPVLLATWLAALGGFFADPFGLP